MRLAGMTYRDIAKELGRTELTCRKLVKSALAKATAESVDEYRQIEAERLDVLLVAIWKQAVVEKDLAAIDRVLKIMERRAKLFGLDLASSDVHQTVVVNAFDSVLQRVEERRQLALANAQRIAPADFELPMPPMNGNGTEAHE